MEITISSELANKAAETMVNYYNDHQGKTQGAVRLIAFRSLYNDLKALKQEHCIASALKPDDYPQKVWFTNNQ